MRNRKNADHLQLGVLLITVQKSPHYFVKICSFILGKDEANQLGHQ